MGSVKFSALVLRSLYSFILYYVMDLFQCYGLVSVLWTCFSVMDLFQCYWLVSVLWTCFSVTDLFRCYGLVSVLWTCFSAHDKWQIKKKSFFSVCNCNYMLRIYSYQILENCKKKRFNIHNDKKARMLKPIKLIFPSKQCNNVSWVGQTQPF